MSSSIVVSLLLALSGHRRDGLKIIQISLRHPRQRAMRIDDNLTKPIISQNQFQNIVEFGHEPGEREAKFNFF